MKALRIPDLNDNNFSQFSGPVVSKSQSSTEARQTTETGLPLIQTQIPGYDITIACPAAAVATPGGSLKALTGTAPDIAADDGRSALKVCLSLIEKSLLKPYTTSTELYKCRKNAVYNTKTCL